ncbi:hypothetical protein N9271_01470 [Pseudomonadales bacterium]|nr:hypothetical protein [Pseudomonadales bacterium]
MNVIETLYKPILPYQMRQLWESPQVFHIADFVGQETTYLFSSQEYTQHLATTFAKELNAICYVLAFKIAPCSYQHIAFNRSLDKDGCVFSVPLAKLDLCFPNIRRVTKIVCACPPPEPNDANDANEQYDLFSNQATQWEPMRTG